jgi:hypothetical protein
MHLLVFLNFIGITWKHKEVLLLISLYVENAVANMMNEKGYTVDGRQCNEEFRALKHRYYYADFSTLTFKFQNYTSF